MARVWDKFLSARDRQHLEGGAPWPSIRFGQRPLLLLIDNYRAVLGDGPTPFFKAIEEFPWSTGEEGWAAIGKTVELLTLFRTLKLPVAHVTSVRPSDGIPRSYEMIHGKPVPPASDDPLYEIVDAVAPMTGEIVFRKAAPSAFHGTNLLSYLTHLKVDTLVVCGEATSGCVRASVTDAASYCFNVYVVEECVYDRHEAAHAINLFDMHRKYACVTGLAEVSQLVRSSLDRGVADPEQISSIK